MAIDPIGLGLGAAAGNWLGKKAYEKINEGCEEFADNVNEALEGECDDDASDSETRISNDAYWATERAHERRQRRGKK